MGSGNSCQEVIDCLLKSYDRSHLLHLAHIHAIAKAPSFKDGHGKQLPHVHEILSEHMLALKTMKYETHGRFIMAGTEQATLELLV